MRFVTGLAGILLAVLSGAASGQGLQDVSISYTPSLTGGVARLAKEMNLFEKHGLNPRLIQMESANATATGLISGSVNAAVTGPGEIIAAQARGVNVVIVANVYNGLNGSIVLAKAVADRLGVSPTAPVADRLKALNGLVFASTSATSAFTVTPKSATDAVGAKMSYTYMGQPAMQAALESGAVQAYIAGAPFWTVPVLNGTGIVWISGPKGEFPRQFAPSSSASVVMLRPFADANPALVKKVAAVFAELAAAFGDRPAEVKAAIKRAFPTVTDAAIETFYDGEVRGFMAKPLTVEDMVHEIAYVKLGGANLPNIDKIDPALLLSR